MNIMSISFFYKMYKIFSQAHMIEQAYICDSNGVPYILDQDQLGWTSGICKGTHNNKIMSTKACDQR